MKIRLYPEDRSGSIIMDAREAARIGLLPDRNHAEVQCSFSKTCIEIGNGDKIYYTSRISDGNSWEIDLCPADCDLLIGLGYGETTTVYAVFLPNIADHYIINHIAQVGPASPIEEDPHSELRTPRRRSRPQAV